MSEEKLKLIGEVDVYIKALTHVEHLFNRLYLMERLNKECCEKCPLMEELAKLRDRLETERFEELERRLGYYLK